MSLSLSKRLLVEEILDDSLPKFESITVGQFLQTSKQNKINITLSHNGKFHLSTAPGILIYWTGLNGTYFRVLEVKLNEHNIFKFV